MALAQDIRELPVVPRLVAVGATLLGVVGGCVGLVLGLLAYPPTAWFAVLEIGVPSAILGALLGLAAGAAVTVARRSHP
ncbi:hypothetical protein [Nocardioides terrae]|nr:hypothetical protein [Nocardioides terrae]